METTCLSLFLNARITLGFFRASKSKQKGNYISLKHRHSYEETPHDKKVFTGYRLQQTRGGYTKPADRRMQFGQPYWW
ncbi:hypothetical protein M408DRAFT_110927 [Serendipita vermifera MAFF 305830]|uniref:Uncharacterized protein n=1 Tax=Serendipita vermifera MAFF 305830 TaxID=933852 RepID=A0A0C2W3Z1_SERVB|nr:hypothetical protein M408DRAFT_110927 [Serendipita vermifera MAFF 305830]